MVFRAIYPAGTKFKYIVQTLAKSLDEIPFIATPEGLMVRSLSPDKTTMLVLNMPSITFNEYECDTEETFIIDADELNRVAKRGTRNDLVELRLDRESRRFVVSFKDKKTGISRSFNLTLREGTVEKISEPKVSLSVMAKMLTDDFKHILRDIKLVGDEVEFIAYENKLEIKCITPQKEYQSILELDKPLLTLIVSQPSSATYAVDLLETTLKATTAAEAVTIEFGTNLPLKLTFELPGGGILVYWIAPRA